MAASMPITGELLRKFGIEELVSFQEQTLDHLLRGDDVFLCKKTGGGKSICYQAYQPCWSDLHNEKCQVLIVCPLISIMKEQCDFLSAAGFSATFIGKDHEEDSQILSGSFQFLFTSPENILGVRKWNDMLRDTDTFRLLVIDEAHTVLHWGESETADNPFRPWYGKLGELRSLMNCPVLLITATANKAARTKLQTVFCMKDSFEIVDNPDRVNIKLFVCKVKCSVPLSEIFYFLIQKIKTDRESCERYIIFCQSIRTCSEIFTMLRLELGEDIKFIEMYHSSTTDVVKDDVKQNMSDLNGSVRILVATSAAGMGVNFKGVKHVIHFGPPTDMDSFVQQYGRAGRDGSSATCLLIYNGKQCKNIDSDMKDYLSNTEGCRRQQILKAYNAKPGMMCKHMCCDLCTYVCNCGDDSCSQNNHPYFEFKLPSFSSESSESSSSDSDWF